MDLSEVRGHVEILQACKRREAELKEMAEQARAVIEEAMGPNEVGELDGQVVLTWRTYKQRRLNQRYLKEKFPEVRELCMETSEYRRMEIQ